MKVAAVVGSLFVLVGMGLCLGALYQYRDGRTFLAQAIKTDGVVLDLEKNDKSGTFSPVVVFLDQDGRKNSFTSSTGSNPPAYSRGERVDVLYLPTCPQQARIDEFMTIWGSTVILTGLGGVFFMCGFMIILVVGVKSRRDRYLQKSGLPVETEFQGVSTNENVSVNGRHPFCVTTQWLNPETSEVHVFRSGDLWFDPTDYIKDKKIRVFIEKNNPKKYHVDLSFLPRLAK